MMRHWIDLTSEEFRDIAPERAIALLPVAAIEQHGPHLTVAVDSDINAGVLAAAATFVDADTPVYILPQLAIGKSNEHGAYPGTLTLSSETLLHLWTEVAESAIRTGFRKLVIFNSHGGQPQIVDIVVRELRVRHHVLAVSANISGLGLPGGLFDREELNHGIHGGAIETSMMLHLRPDRVRENRIAEFPSVALQIERGNSLLRLEGPIAIGWMTQDVNVSGAVGDARKADAQRGAACVDHAGRQLATLLREVSRYSLEHLQELS